MFVTRKAIVLALIIGPLVVSAPVSAQLQTPLPGSSIPQFVDPLPRLFTEFDTVVADTDEIELHMREFKASVLPAGFLLPDGTTYSGTWVWGYVRGPNPPAAIRPTYLGPVIVATRNLPTQLRFVNDLGFTSTTNVLAYKNSTDQTLHWADPLHAGTMDYNMCAHRVSPMPMGDCSANYDGPIPATVHVHGGEVPPEIDGGPDSWFTSDGLHHGSGYYTHPGIPVAGNEAVYRYPNTQEAAPIWFHDHTLGATRLNVYCGLAGAYLIVDPANSLPANLPGPGEIIPLVIQDRMFDTNGQLFFPAGPPESPNPDHPFWVPEFIGDAICVNGKTWPYLNVAPKRYRFLIINGSNARAYEMFLTNPRTKENGPPLWQIATDGGYLDAPVEIDPNAAKPARSMLVVMPGERAELIIDFGGLPPQTRLHLKNIAKAPYPAGDAALGATVGRILEIRVNLPLAGPDTSYDPASGTPLRTGAGKIVRLADPAAGTLAPGVTARQVRQLTLNEVMGMPAAKMEVEYPGGPLEILVNNTKWDGIRSDGTVRTDFRPVTVGGLTAYLSETPGEGDTEVWEIVNLTADAHPMHTHLTQFQLINRQGFDARKYDAAYNAAFPGGAFIPGYGPPLDYNTGNPRALGGNPDVVPFLRSVAQPPFPNEAGWKDTIMSPPGMVTRFVVRFAPMYKPIADLELFYPFVPFDPARGYSYVWHCHIVDHEDNEMMRPYAVLPDPDAAGSRTYLHGSDY
jgi:FtsP/CotA-like multicopper oxidase with cupredoxin domain